MSGIAPGTMQQRWLQYLKHRRFWIHSVDPIGPSQPRITEDGILRETEDGATRVTEGT